MASERTEHLRQAAPTCEHLAHATLTHVPGASAPVRLTGAGQALPGLQAWWPALLPPAPSLARLGRSSRLSRRSVSGQRARCVTAGRSRAPGGVLTPRSLSAGALRHLPPGLPARAGLPDDSRPSTCCYGSSPVRGRWQASGHPCLRGASLASVIYSN